VRGIAEGLAMQEPLQPGENAGTPNEQAETAAGASEEPVALIAPVVGLIYDLRLGHEISDEFYEKTARFSEQLLAEIEARGGTFLNRYTPYVQEYLREAPRSRGDYALDLLTLGLALGRYGGAAERSPGWAVAMAQEFLWLRRESFLMKPVADLARAVVARFFLAAGANARPATRPFTTEQLPRIIDWLQATGEFEQETMRLNNCRSFLATLDRAEASRWMEVAVEAFYWFEGEAAEALGAYTSGVAEFLATARDGCGLREDLVLREKRAVEYHLGMVAAEIMNRGLREEFDRTPRKVVLVPACMRGRNAAGCQARVEGTDMTCSGCDPNCAVNRMTRRMRELGAAVYLVPHTTGFSRWLDRWQREPEVGVAAVACLLNILPGGYAMRARRISAQCVPLDYPGCRKHWNSEGIPTGVNEERLVRIVLGKQA
jgi:hypothetical protein